MDASTPAEVSPSKMSRLPAIGTKLVVEINGGLVDAIVLSYLKGKKTLTEPLNEAESVKLQLIGLQIGDRTMDTETSISIKYLKEIVRDSKNKLELSKSENDTSEGADEAKE